MHLKFTNLQIYKSTKILEKGLSGAATGQLFF